MNENGSAVFPEAEGTRENDEVLRGAELRHQIEELREDILQEVRAVLDADALLKRLSSAIQQSSTTVTHGNLKSSHNANKNGESKIAGKKFVARESELTNLMRINHIATIYNVFVATLISLFLSTVMHDFISTGSVNLGFHLLSWNFARYPTAIYLSGQMMVACIGVYYGYVLWAKLRSLPEPKSVLMRDIIDKLGLIAFLFVILLHMWLPCRQVRALNMPFACSMTVMLEQIRLLMKVYAFVRTNAPRTLDHCRTPAQPYFVPPLSKYLYFLFAPTLIYRDDYPRTRTIRWGYAAARFAEVLCIILYLAFVSERYILPRMRDFGKPGTDKPWIYLASAVIDNSLPAVVLIVCGFYLILHAWLNCTAEVLRFADRMFYSDWWNTTVYAEYYKTWNIVVYDWLHTFIYKDAGSALFVNKYLRAVLVIAVSAIFHEYAMVMGLGYFMPAFVVIYGLGGPMVMQLSSSNAMVGNVWIWFTLCLGSGMMVTVYLAEYYARINCPRTLESNFWDMMIPRMSSCQYS